MSRSHEDTDLGLCHRDSKGLELLVTVVAHDRLFLIASAGEVDVLVTIAAAGDDEPSLLTRGGLVARYRCFPSSRILDREPMRQLELLCAEALRRGPRLGPPPAAVTLSKLIDTLPQIAPLHVRCTVESIIRVEAVRDNVPGAAVCELTPQRPGLPGLLGWTPRCRLHGDWPSADRELLRRRLATIIALAAVHGPLVAAQVSGARPGRRVHLAHPLVLADLEPGGTLDVVVPSTCEQRCVFCDSPMRRRRFFRWRRRPLLGEGLAGASRLAAALAGSGTVIQLTGPDPLNAPEILELLGIFHGSRVEVMSPGTRLTDEAFVRALVATGVKARVHLTLHGPDAATHDAVAGRRGAFMEMCAALAHCAAAGVPVALNHVLCRQNLGVFPETLRMASSMGKRLQVLMPISRTVATTRRVLPALGVVRGCFEENTTAVLENVRTLWHYPLCALPAPLRVLAQWNAEETWKEGRTCAGCSALRAPCAGPPRHTLRVLGEQDLVAQR